MTDMLLMACATTIAHPAGNRGVPQSGACGPFWAGGSAAQPEQLKCLRSVSTRGLAPAQTRRDRQKLRPVINRRQIRVLDVAPFGRFGGPRRPFLAAIHGWAG